MAGLHITTFMLVMVIVMVMGDGDGDGDKHRPAVFEFRDTGERLRAAAQLGNGFLDVEAGNGIVADAQVDGAVRVAHPDDAQIGTDETAALSIISLRRVRRARGARW